MSTETPNVEAVASSRKHRAKARLYLALKLLCGGLGVADFGWFAISFNNAEYFQAFAAFVCVGPLSGAYAGFDHRWVENRFYWAHRLSVAESLARMAAEKDWNYCVVLRPFKLDAEVQMNNDFNPFRFLPVGFGMPMVDVQEWLMRSAGVTWRFLVAVDREKGLSTGHIRGAYVELGSDWLEDVRKLVRAADVIVFVPGGTPGIGQELELILKERPHHTVILFPRQQGNERLYKQIDTLASLDPYRPLVPRKGAIILPLKDDADAMHLQAYPLTPTSARKVLKARSGAQID